MYVKRVILLLSMHIVAVVACQQDVRQNDEVRLSPRGEPSSSSESAEHAVEHSLPSARDAGTARAPTPPLVAPYVRGAWRQAARAELQRVSLWFSHILIRHEALQTRDVSFCVAGWRSTPELPARTREEALALAQRVAERAMDHPASFSRLVAQYSEDITTRDRGGSLGPVTALHLMRWPAILDALAVVRPGEASQVVETEYGFHILYRRTPPKKQTISGAHLVIGHDQAEFLAQLRGEPIPARSRDEGLTLALQVRAKLASNPELLAQRISEYSEHPDAVVGGDMGEWSSREPTDYPRQMEALSNLAVGEIAAPLETLFGWEILVRTPNRPRQRYAMTAVEVPFDVDADASGDSSPRSAALTRATELARLLQEKPERFSDLQQQECCRHVAQWPEGKGWPPLMAVLKELQPGQIARSPVAFGFSYIIPKRVEAKPEAPIEARFELPTG